MAKAFTHLPERRILRRQHVERLTGLSRSTLYQWIREGLFPAPIPLGPRAVGWDSNEIERWIEQRLHQDAPKICRLARTTNCGKKVD